MVVETDPGVMCLPAKERQGLPAAPGDGKGQEEASPRSSYFHSSHVAGCWQYFPFHSRTAGVWCSPVQLPILLCLLVFMQML